MKHPHWHPIRQRALKRAYAATKRAVKAGRLARPRQCPECGAMKRRALHSHHPNLQKPLQVEWVCVRCHGELAAILLRLADVPQTVRIAVKAKAKREGVSLRALVLKWLKEWIDK